MYRVRFRNGVDAQEILLDVDDGRPLQFETEKEARAQLPEIVRRYGTVDDAAAWIDGDDPPEHLSEEAVVSPIVEEPEPAPEPEPDDGEGEGEVPPLAQELLPQDLPRDDVEDTNETSAEPGEDLGTPIAGWATAAAADLAAAEGIDLADVEGTGAGDRVTKADVEKAIEERSA
jgi:pyruvate/2-oxoglutarate dehydrogenase complex dihydrolipoamide acyltransferase (E2) component